MKGLDAMRCRGAWMSGVIALAGVVAAQPATVEAPAKKTDAKLEKFEQETAVIRELLEREEVLNNLRSDKVANLEYLKKEHNVST